MRSQALIHALLPVADAPRVSASHLHARPQFDQFALNLKQAGLVASYSGLMNVCSRALGGIVSDLAAKRFGMRGRLWTLWFLQTASGGVCVAFGYCSDSLNHSITTMIIFSFLTQMSCGATYGIVPFSARPVPACLPAFRARCICARFGT
jgi:nitrate/nitrite transporter NarK